MRLLTLVHISDLHVGDTDLAGIAAELPSPLDRTPEWLRSKLYGHEVVALQALEELLEEMPEEDKPFDVWLSGDLTSFGKASHFEAVRSFLTGDLVIGDGDPFGPRLAAWEQIPGNHDHWPGKARIFGAETKAFHATFPPAAVPFYNRLIDLDGGLRIRLMGIDTDCDVAPVSRSRFFARGSFVHHLDRLQTELPDPHPDEIRVLLLHHSPGNRKYVLGLEGESRLRLWRLLATKDVAVMLTGHMHVPLLELHAIDRSRKVLEARCGTTTQLVNPSAKQQKRLEAKSKGAKTPPTLLVHRVEREEDKIHWKVQAYVLTREGFRFAPIYPENKLVSTEFQVWPRP